MSAQTCPTCTGPVELVPEGEGSICPSCSARFGGGLGVSADAITIQGNLAQLIAESKPKPKKKDEPPKNPFSKDFMSRFEMAGFLGKGAMGAVWMMRQLNLDRLVAVKAVKGAGLTEKENKRLLKEAKVIARLNHPHIRAIHDVGIDGHVPYMICEYVDGETLSSKLKRDGALPLEESLRTALGILEGLAFAHQEGVVHRDLKPGNILLGRDGRPKIVDFGLATVSNMNSIETISGRILGTPRYMSPEQCEGEDTTFSSDLYAMGVVLFEMLTGQMPFDGPGPMNFMDQHLHAVPRSLTAVRADLPVELEAILQKALAKKSADRHSSAEQMTEELMSIYSGLTAVRFMSRPPRDVASRAGLSAAATSAGMVLAERYELVRPLGHGELGELWLARDQALEGSEVSIRLLSGRVWSDPNARATLVREAKQALKLAHPNVVRLITLEPGTPPFLVGEYVEGPSLATELARRARGQAAAYTPGEALPLIESICAGLDHAHARGVFHRDIRPEAIVLEAGESAGINPRITDFGIATALIALPSRTPPAPGQNAYRSPEQLAGIGADARSDVFGLAAVVYHMLTLVPPLPSLDENEISWPILRPREVLEAPPDAVAQVVAQALSREPDNRPATAGAFLAAYRAAMASASKDSIAAVSRKSGWFKALDATAQLAPAIPSPAQGLTRQGLFQLITDEVFKDGVVEEWENRALVAMTEYLEIKLEDARTIAYQSRERFQRGRLGSKRPLDARVLYSKALYFAHENGAITDERDWMLEGLRKLFAITPEDHAVLLQRVRAKLS